MDDLKRIIDKSYCPLSNYAVSAKVVGKYGTGYGVNVESRDLVNGSCAELNAFSDYFTQGLKKEDIISLFVYVKSDILASPCFLCRQYISELMDKNALIVLLNDNSEKEYKVSELCPYPFGSFNL